MHTDPIADMLTRIRNAQAVGKLEVVLPFSKLKFNIAKKIKENGYLNKVEIIEAKKTALGKRVGRGGLNSRFDQIKLELLYDGGKPKITDLRRISKPSRRIYVKKDKLPVVLNNLGIAIISTPKGLMTSREATKQNLGGEIICEIY